MQHLNTISVKVSIIIVSYNSYSELNYFFKSLIMVEPNLAEVEIILVENGTSKAVGKIQSDYSEYFNRFSLMWSDNNVGFGGGNNIGANVATGSILAFFNPDLIFQEPIITKIITNSEKYTLSGFKLYSLQGNVINYIGYRPKYFLLNPILKILTPLIGNDCFSFLRFFYWPWGASLIVKSHDFRMIGGFDESFFLCNEEPDLVERLGVTRFGIIDAKIIHDEGHSGNGKFRRSMYIRSTARFFKKYNLKGLRYYLRNV